MLILAGIGESEARAAGVPQRTPLANVADASDLERLLSARGAAYEAVLIGPRVEDPVAALRRIKARAPDLPVLILAPVDRCARIQHALLLTPTPGEPARCVPMNEGTPRAIEQHLMQARLRRRHRESLAEANRQMRAPTVPSLRLPPAAERLLDAAPVGVLLVEPDGGVLFRNRLARGLADPRAPVRTLADALPGAADDAVARLARASDATPKVRLALRPPEGDARHFDATAVEVEIASGRRVRFVTLDDVTSLVAAERRLEEARAAIGKVDKLTSMGSLVGGLAHEIRTPLTSVLNHAMLLEMVARRALRSDEPRPHLARLDEHVQEIASGIDRVQALVRDLNRFMRGERPTMEPVALEDAIGEAVRIFQAAQRGRVRVEAELSGGGMVLADRVQVQQVALNLLQNAADATPSGGVVRVATRSVPRGVELVVTDHGGGIAPDVQPRMFEAFVTTKPDGTGLGLAIVRRIAELHDAKVTFETSPRGTTFVVRFPTPNLEAGPARGTAR